MEEEVLLWMTTIDVVQLLEKLTIVKLSRMGEIGSLEVIKWDNFLMLMMHVPQLKEGLTFPLPPGPQLISLLCPQSTTSTNKSAKQKSEHLSKKWERS